MNLSQYGMFIISRFCETCKFQSKDNVAEEFCVDCKESHCNICARKHRMHKLSARHEEKSIKARITSCEPCKVLPIETFCRKCKEFYCKECGEHHKAQKCSRFHELSKVCIPEDHIIISVSDEYADDTVLKREIRGSHTPPTETLSHKDDPCKGISDRYSLENKFDHKEDLGDKERHESFSYKKSIQDTEDHESKTSRFTSTLFLPYEKRYYSEKSKDLLMSFSTLPDNANNDFKANGSEDATICTKQLKKDMKQVLENDPHSVKKDYAQQNIATNSDVLNLKSNQNFELLYDRQNQHPEAHEAELQRAVPGRGMDSDRDRNQTSNTEQFKVVTRDATTQYKQAEMIQTTLIGKKNNRNSDVDLETMNTGRKKTSAAVEKRKDPRQPGRPSACDTQSTHTTLTWPNLVITKESDVVEVFLKEAKYGSWRQYNLNCVDTQFSLIEGLRPDTQYVFKIRMMNKNTGKSGPFSNVSDVIQTKSSPAMLYKSISKLLSRNSMVYQLPLKEDKKYLDKTRKIRKYSIGHQISTLHEKTVLLIGESGAGKSTMIDCLANYSLGVTVQDPFRFTLTSEDDQNITVRARTKWITIYTLHPSKENGFPFVLNMIDTPGLGGGKRKDEDESLICSIEVLLKYIEKIDVVGVVLKSSDSRLSVSQRLLFDSFLNIFGYSISRNMCALITFCDSQTPPVVNAMKTFHQALPHDKYFCFNNCSLFSTKKQESNREAFWKMGKVQFDLLLKYLSTVDSQTVVLTYRQLQVREEITCEIQCLERFFMKAICELNNVMRKHHTLQGKDKEQFQMETEVLEYVYRPVSYKDQNTLFCTRCKKTCCRSCHVTRDIDRNKCPMFKQNGYCRACRPAQCHVSEHVINTNYIMEFIPVKKKMAFEVSHMDRHDVIRKLNHERDRLIKNLLVILQVMTKKHNALHKKSCHPVTLTTLELIDSLIEITSEEGQSYPSGTQHILHNLKDELPSQQVAIDDIHLEDVIKELNELK